MAAKAQSINPDEIGGAGASPPQTVTLTLDDLNTLIAQQVTAAIATAAATNTPGAPAAGPDFKSMFAEMAMTFADIAQQGNRTYKAVDPRILKARQIGQDKLNTILDRIQRTRKAAFDASYPSEVERNAAVFAVTPQYRCIATIVLEDELIFSSRLDEATKKPVPVLFYWAAEPNDAMVPMNDIAREVHTAFRESRGARTDIEKRTMKPAWMTDRGLVIEGFRAPARRDLPGAAVLRDLEIPGTPSELSDPEPRAVPVLGTSHPPFQVLDRHLQRAPDLFEGR